MTDIVFPNARADAAAGTIAGNASVVAASGNRVIWRDDACDKGSCTHVYDLQKRKSSRAPVCKSGDTVGVGTLDPSGRWYAGDLRTDGLAILDLRQGTCRELDALPAPESSDLQQTFGIAWSGPILLLLDQRSGSLAYVNAPHGKVGKRAEPLPVVNEAQVWSATTD